MLGERGFRCCFGEEGVRQEEEVILLACKIGNKCRRLVALFGFLSG